MAAKEFDHPRQNLPFSLLACAARSPWDVAPAAEAAAPLHLSLISLMSECVALRGIPAR